MKNNQPSSWKDTDSFAVLFRRLRVLSGFFSLRELSEALYELGLYIDVCTLSRWQTGNRTPRSRETIIFVIQAFHHNGGISIKEANDFLESAQLGYLTDDENQDIFGEKEKILER